MIARAWHGEVEVEAADEYFEYLRETGIPDYQSTEGNRGLWVLRRQEGDRTHFLLITLWEDLAAIKAFAGEDYAQAVYYPEDSRYLLELEPAVTHYEVLLAE